MGAKPRVDGATGRPVSARRSKTMEERRAEIVAANARLRSKLLGEYVSGSDSPEIVSVPRSDPELRTLETQRDTLRAQVRQLTGVLASRREEIQQLRNGANGANGPHGHGALAPPPALDRSDGLTPSELDDSDYVPEEVDSDEVEAEGGGGWEEDMMSVITRDKREAERGSSRSLHGDGVVGSEASATNLPAAAAAVGDDAAESSSAGLSGQLVVTVAGYEWSEGAHRLGRPPVRVQVDASASAEEFYSALRRAVGWEGAAHGAFQIWECLASEGPAPAVFGGEQEETGARPLLDAFTVRGLGLWQGCIVQVRLPADPGRG